ncbi:hypothetical protein D9M71_426470 [compost metagenome]
MDHYQGLFVRRKFRVGVVVTHERYALGTTTTDRLFIDLRFAATVGSEVKGVAIFAPERLGIDTRACSNTADLARGHIHHVDVRVAVLGQHERQARTVRRPGWRTVQAFEVGHLLAAASIDVLHEDTWALLLERNVGDPFAIWRKARRQDRLTRLQQGHRTRTVVVRTLEGVAGVVGGETLSRHVQHARRERALDAGELLERLVGDVVRHVAQLVGAARHAAGQHLLLGGDVEQRVLHLQATARRHDAADHHVLCTQRFPVTEDHFAGLRRLADHVLPRNRRVVAGVA